MRKLFVIFLILAVINSNAQLTITAGGGTAGVTSAIAGPGLTVSGVTINCGATSYGSFSGASGTFGMTNGLMLTTGNATDVLGANTANDLSYCVGTSASDPQLTALSAQATYDPCIIEFDVIPQCGTISITFVFGSDEYLDYVSAGFNDAFGFFVTGPNPAGGSYTNYNLAQLPAGGGAVSIDNVNNVAHPAYYIDNPTGTTNSFDGYTTAITATMNVTPCATYHFKIAIADASDCAMDSGVLIDLIQCTSPWTVSTSSTPATCGMSNGSATATVTGGIGPFTYSWSPGGATTATASGLAAGTYNCTVNDGLSCTPSQVVTVTVGSTGTPPTINVTPTASFCIGGSATLTATGGTSYSWSPATGLSATTGASVTASPTVSTTYTVTGTGTCGTAIATSIVTVNPLPTVTVPSVSKCAGAPGVTLTASGASTYSWSPATGLSATTGSSVTANPASTTTYTITGTSASGCVATTTAILTVNSLPTVTVPAASKCAGAPGVTLTASGASTYSWSPATGLSATTGTSVTANPSVTTTYTITGTNASGCTGTTTSIVTVTPGPTVTVPPATICNGSSTTLTASGASTYTWSPATGLSATTGTSVTANPTTTTTYSITGTNASGCTGTTTTIVTVNPLPTVSVPGASICPSSSTTLTASGASTYSWSPATGLSATTGTSVTASPAVTTTYTITGTNASGCTSTTTAIVTVGGSITITVPPATICNGSSTTLTASGGSTYSWSPATGLSATTGASVTANPTTTTTYSITGTSAAGCTGTTTSIVTVNPLPTVSVPSAAICIGNSTTLTAAGASTYSWSPATGLSATTGASVTANPTVTTTYTITGTSAAGCTSTTTSIVTVNALPTVSVNSASICAGDNTTLTAGGASTYTWSPATGLSATTGASVTATPASTTTYTVTGTSATGCISTATSIVTISTTFNANITPAGPFCQTAAAVNLTAVDPGGIWSGTGITNAALGTFDPVVAGAGTFTIQYLIPGGCGDTSTTSITVVATDDPSFTYPAVLCSSAAAVTLTPTLVGGSWTSSCGACVSVAGVFNPALASIGANTVTYTTGGMCPSSQTNTITVDQISITAIDTIGVSCNGLTDGTITVTAPGATQYSIDGGMSWQASNVFNVGAGSYTITVQNANGCQATASAVVTQPTALTINVGIITPETCAGMCDGQIAALPSGGTLSYTVNWSGASTTTGLTVTGACSGTYNATVTDGHGCTATGTVTMVSPATVSIISVTPTDPTCNGGTNGDITVVGSATVTQYSIDGGITFQAAGTFTGLPAGTYPIEVTDPAGCSATSTVTINEPTPVAVTASADVTICNGQSTTLSATPSGGTPGYNVSWNDPTSATTTSVSVNPSATTTYTVTVSDNNGCGPVTDNVTVTVNPALTVVGSADVSICPGASTTISALASGGNGGPYTYTWSPASGLSSTTGASVTATPTSTTTYTVTVSDGCTVLSAVDYVVVSLYSLPGVSYSIDNNAGCSPVVVNFTNTMSSGVVSSSSWDFDNGSVASGTTAMGVFINSGCYDITLTVTTTDGCVVDTTIANQVCVYDNPIADFSFAPQPTTVMNPTINFTNLSTNGDNYVWDFAGMGTSSDVNPTYVFPNDNGGIYTVCLTVSTNQGCIDSVCHEVEILDEFLVYVPNAFTPDGDGVNDVFLPIIQGEKPDSYELMIFNRWGEMIYTSNNKEIGWDGTHNGQKAKEDVYVWKLKVKKKINEDKEQYVGHVNLLR